MAKKKVDREWILAQFSRGVAAEQAMEADARATAESPPDPTLAVLYHQIANDDQRHAGIVELIATRYGYQAAEHKSGGLSGTLGRLKEAVSEMGASPQQRLEHDLGAKSSAIHWATSWVYTFEQVGDSASSQELAALLADEKAHHDALQQGLNNMLLKGAQGKLG